MGFGLFRSPGTNINVSRPKRRPIKIRKRQFTKESIDEFNNLVQKK
jgi:hypothetical protein